MLCHHSLIPRTEHTIFLSVTFCKLKDDVFQNYIGHHQNESLLFLTLRKENKNENEMILADNGFIFSTKCKEFRKAQYFLHIAL